MGVLRDDYRRAMGRFVTGVTIITTRLGDELHGMTANAVTGLSLEPLLILISVDKSSDTHDILSQGGAFTVNILGRDQEALSKKFASKREAGSQKLDGVPHTLGVNGCPVLEGAIAHLDCVTTRQYEGGDHTIFIGEVVDAKESSDGDPLVFYGGRYFDFTASP
jgi:flavin reductase (DIM6/NTAB) family NADH-FMN oxidoreductase RutF